MMLEIVRSGLLTTVQDIGRHGSRQYGVSICGALDDFALRASNILVGNDESDAALEVTLAGCEVRFRQDALVAICGGDIAPHVGADEVPGWCPVFIEAEATIAFRHRVSGCRAYLAVAGGVSVPEIMGSRSTDLRARFGGFGGRALRSGDVLPTGSPNEFAPVLLRDLSSRTRDAAFVAPRWSVSARARPAYTSRPTLRMVAGDGLRRLDVESRRNLFAEEFVVTEHADRMGYRLGGCELKIEGEAVMLSTAVTQGCLQVPPDGDPILLLADCQTVGGYPVVAHVIHTDLPLVAQTIPGDCLRFAEVTLAEAHRLRAEAERDLRVLKCAVRLRA